MINAGYRIGSHPAAVQEQAGNQYEEEAPERCGSVWLHSSAHSVSLLFVNFSKW